MAGNESKRRPNSSKAGRALVLAVIMLTMGQTGYLGSAQQSTSQSVDGAHLSLGEAMTDITFQYDSSAAIGSGSNSNSGTYNGNGTVPASWRAEPALPAGISISGGTISGTPSVYASNQTYTIYAEQGGEATTFEIYLSVGSDNPHTVVEGQPIGPIGFHDPLQELDTAWSVSPSLPPGLTMDPATGEITGSVEGELPDTTYTMTATEAFPFAYSNDKLSVKGQSSCAILDNGSLMCWGAGYWGQLGTGGNTDEDTPTFVDLGQGRTAVSVSSSGEHSCAILDNGSLTCWGLDNQGQLGTSGGNQAQNTPTMADIGTDRTAVAVSAGGAHTCAILEDGSLKCWGANQDGQLGHIYNGDYAYSHVSTVPFAPGRTTVAVSAGGAHTCAILDNASLWCWGAGDYGQLGDGLQTDQPSPVWVDLGAGRTATAVSAGASHTCAILDDGCLLYTSPSPRDSR